MQAEPAKKHRYINLREEVHEKLDELRKAKSKLLGVELSWSEFLSNLHTEYSALLEKTEEWTKEAKGKVKR